MTLIFTSHMIKTISCWKHIYAVLLLKHISSFSLIPKNTIQCNFLIDHHYKTWITKFDAVALVRMHWDFCTVFMNFNWVISITSNDSPFGCPIICTDIYSQCHFVPWHLRQCLIQSSLLTNWDATFVNNVRGETDFSMNVPCYKNIFRKSTWNWEKHLVDTRHTSGVSWN